MSSETMKWVGIRLAADRYEILAKLGEGGMGVAYLARDNRLGAEVVIKLPHAGLIQDEKFAVAR